MLSGAKVTRVVGPARASMVVDGPAAALKPSEQARPYGSCYLELDGLSGLLGDDVSLGSDGRARYEVANLDLHQVAASQLAVDR